MDSHPILRAYEQTNKEFPPLPAGTSRNVLVSYYADKALRRAELFRYYSNQVYKSWETTLVFAP